MERGLYIAAAGMAAGLRRQDLLSNDLANAATPGYKADRAAQRSFGDLLLANSASGAPIGRLGTGVELAGHRLDLTQGAIRDTGEPLDFAIDGDGFFALRTPEGIRYTRSGQFTASDGGTLVDAFGNTVLGRDGGPLRVTGGRVDPELLQVTALTDPRKAGDGLLTGAPAGAATGRVRSAALEGSAVDLPRTLIEMMTTARSAQTCQRAITTIDETLGRGASQVGNLG